MRVPIEEVDFPIRAYNTLKACNVHFLDEIRPLLNSTDPQVTTNQNLRRARQDILRRLREWGGDDGSGAPARA
jgi:hypothetical protein